MGGSSIAWYRFKDSLLNSNIKKLQPSNSSAFKRFVTNYERANYIWWHNFISDSWHRRDLEVTGTCDGVVGDGCGSCALPTFTQPTPFFKVCNLSLQVRYVHLKRVFLSLSTEWHNDSYAHPTLIPPRQVRPLSFDWPGYSLAKKNVWMPVMKRYQRILNSL